MGLGWEVCTSHQLAGDAEAAGPKATLSRAPLSGSNDDSHVSSENLWSE